MAETKDLSLLKNISEFEKAINDGFEIPIYNWIKIKPKSGFVDKKAKIDIYYNNAYVDYSEERLNEILYAVARKSIQEIIKQRNDEWEKLKKSYVE